MKLWKRTSDLSKAEILRESRILRAISWAAFFIAIIGSILTVLAASALEVRAIIQEPVLFALALNGVTLGVGFSITMGLLSVILDRKIEYYSLLLRVRDLEAPA